MDKGLIPGVTRELIWAVVVSLEQEYIADKEVKWEGWLQKYAGDFFVVSQVCFFRATVRIVVQATCDQRNYVHQVVGNGGGHGNTYCYDSAPTNEDVHHDEDVMIVMY